MVKNETKKKKNPAAICMILSFIVPVVILAAAYFMKGIYPGGPNTILTYDLKAQYMPFFSSLRYIGSSDNSIFLSMSGALGNNFWGMAYYIFSPMTWVTVLFPLDSMPTALYCTTLLRIGLCGLCFYSYLIYTYDKEKHYTGAFLISCCYALMSYNVGYSVNLMWLDAVYMLPLILIGVERILKDKNTLVLTVTVAFSMICNYYITCMSLVFVAFYTLIRLTELKKWNIKKFLQLVSSGLLGICISMSVVLPGVWALRSGKLDEGTDEIVSFFRYNLIDVLGQFFSGKYDTVLDDGLPFVFCGTGTLLMVIMYFVGKKTGLRIKCLYGALVVFYLFSMCFVPLDRAMQGFSDPTCFEVRYAFAVCGLLLILAYRSLDDICDILFKHNVTLKIKYVAGALIILELFMNSSILIAGLMVELRYRPTEEYDMILKSKRALVESISDEEFYRISDDYPYTDNDGAWLGYNGFGYFSSSYNLSVMDYLGSLGECQTYHLLKDKDRTPLEESLLGAKYKLSFIVGRTYDDIIGTDGFFTLSRNTDALSLGYMVYTDESRETSKISANAFENQNNLAKDLSGLDEDVFIELDPYEYEEINTEGCSKHIRLSIETKEDAPVWMYIEQSDWNEIKKNSTDYDNPQTKLIVNGEEWGEFWKTDSTFAIFLGDYKAGEKIDIETLSTVYHGSIHVDYIDEKTYSSVIAVLKQRELELSEHSSGHFKGKIDAGEGGNMILTLPKMDGWKISVDGNSIEYGSYRDVLITLPLTAGVHDIDIRYISPGVYAGLAIGVVSLIITFIMLFGNIRTVRRNI